MYRRAAAVILATACLVPVVSFALTNQELLQQVSVITARILELQALLDSRQSGGTASNSNCPSLTRDIGFGFNDASSGGEVSVLQRFLKSSGDYTYPSITGYFGMVTQAAVQRFQLRSHLVADGSVVKATRAAIQAACAPVASTPSTPPPLPTATSCTIGGLSIAEGTSRTFYLRPTVPYNELCSTYAQTRTCGGGILGGDPNYVYAGCTVSKVQSCNLGGLSLAQGASASFYSTTTAPYGSSCGSYSQTRACNNGTLSGSDTYNHAACSSAAGASCVIDGYTLPHASSTSFYLARSIASGELCTSYMQTRSCLNGTLSGNASYAYASCAPVASGTCALDNVTLASGSSGVFYLASAAPAGKACSDVALTRTCTNGTLSGDSSYVRATCTATASCSLGGVTLAHASSSVFYASSTIPYGTTCSSKSQTRTCTNGALGGDASFSYASCTVNPPTAMAPNQNQLAAALAALQSLVDLLAHQITGR